MNEVNIGILEPAQWEIYKSLQLAALKEDPTVYKWLYEELEKEPDEVWKKRLESHGEQNWYYFAESGGSIIGFISAEQHLTKKTQHIATINCIYAAKEKHIVVKLLLGKMVGELLQSGVTKNRIYVNTKLTQDIKILQEFGFNIKGTFEKENYINGVYYDLHVLEKITM